jgi:hypothetical protein
VKVRFVLAVALLLLCGSARADSIDSGAQFTTTIEALSWGFRISTTQEEPSIQLQESHLKVSHSLRGSSLQAFLLRRM